MSVMLPKAVMEAVCASKPSKEQKELIRAAARVAGSGGDNCPDLGFAYWFTLGSML